MKDDRLVWKYPRMLALLLALAALLIGGCGGDGDDNSGRDATAASESRETTETSEAQEAAAKEDSVEERAIVNSIGLPRVGYILIDQRQFTLYGFSRDRNGKSSCYGACAKTWRPMLTEERPAIAYGAYGDYAHMTRRRDGSMQVVYAGHPAYYYVGDKRRHESNGEGVREFGGVWRAIRVREPPG